MTSNTCPDGPKGIVIACSAPGSEALFAHERHAINAVARQIALLKGFAFEGDLSAFKLDGEYLYYVPDDSLLLADASRMGIAGPKDFFGGVLPSRLAMTKVITHNVIGASAFRPDDWPAEFPERVSGAVLPGYSTFSRTDTLQAADRLLRQGPVRLKPPLASRGREQQIASSVSEVEAFLERYQASNLEKNGFVLETNLADIATLSVGIADVGEIAIAYVGTQRITADNAGQPVYGGSDIIAVRGGWEALAGLSLSSASALAVAQARTYDAAMIECPGFFASRRNYDIGQGTDWSGKWKSGVLEACWRIGGSSTAELAAMNVMQQYPDVQFVCASAVKAFGMNCQPPANATVHFQGEDPDEGAITRYTAVTRISRKTA
ncbi:DUF3182 family protein [Mesorhizobium sp. M0051]|uniref:DUF3182 family protein n=1 Tax=Mesorhizobium sp. M0051 TaxID=2956862 RepID=UPI0033380589